MRLCSCHVCGFLISKANGVARSDAVDVGYGLQVWRVASNTSKGAQTAEWEWSSSLGF